MIKRIEFVLYLDDPKDAELYRALRPLMVYRRAGHVIRQALVEALLKETPVNLVEKKEQSYEQA